MFKKLWAIVLICFAIYWSFNSLLPATVSDIHTKKTAFSTARALIHLNKISEKPHYVGNSAHAEVRDYIISELKKLGLQPQVQEGYSMSKWGNFVYSKNILARIKGSHSETALMLLSHYDSNPHSSFGASDAGSGVVTILEGIRAYLETGKTPKNDIIILISDAEELGLNGAHLFVDKHPWAKDVGLVLNFEARGSGGPSYMLIETNGGNSNLIKSFVKANPKVPVSNSLAYSVYKMLPNDTDLTVFREKGNIEGFNFAFIDDHFDYHTALDVLPRLDAETLEHQGSYLTGLLNYFDDANLNNLKSDTDSVYFNAPIVKMIYYPFSWIWPMLVLACSLFLGLVIIGFKNNKLQFSAVLKGGLAFVLALIVSGVVCYFGWQLLLKLYPHYGDILHGFTYNGYTYITAFVFLTLGICFFCYHKLASNVETANLMVIPILFWLLICGASAYKLQGASFLVIPVFFAILSFYLLVKQKQPSVILLTLLGFPLLIIMGPFVKMFPVGLGLKMLVISGVLVVLIFGLLISVLHVYKHKLRWAKFSFIMAGIAIIYAHVHSNFTNTTPKPNSLVYLHDSDSKQAKWLTYDEVLDDWTIPYLGEDPDVVSKLNTSIFGSKYKTGFTYSRNTVSKHIPEPLIEVHQDTIVNNIKRVTICITPQREVNRIELFSELKHRFNIETVNGFKLNKKSGTKTNFIKRKTNRLFTYYVTDNRPLELVLRMPVTEIPVLTIFEASFNLLENSKLNLTPRKSNQIPKPFVLNDAIIVKKRLELN